MSSDSGKPLEFENSTTKKETTGFSEERPSLDCKDTEEIHHDTLPIEKQLNKDTTKFSKNDRSSHLKELDLRNYNDNDSQDAIISHYNVYSQDLCNVNENKVSETEQICIVSQQYCEAQTGNVVVDKQSTNEQDSLISQIKLQQTDDVEAKLQSLPTISDHVNTTVLTKTNAILLNINKVMENELKGMDTVDQLHINTVPLIEKTKSSKQEPLLDLNDDKFLEEISKNLVNRDMTMYDRTFLGIDTEDLTKKDRKSTVSDIKELESISSKDDRNKPIAIMQLKITENVKLLKVDESTPIENSGEVSLLKSLIEENTSEEISSIKNVQTLIQNEFNTSETETISKLKGPEEPSDLIEKLQNMKWLKPSATESTMTRIRKPTLKALPKKDERVENYFEGTKKNKKSSNDAVLNKNQSAPTSLDLSIEIADQPNLGKKNAVEQLFPEVQLANTIEDEELSQAIVQSICTAQQECEKRKMAGILNIQAYDKEENSEWGKQIYRNLPDEDSASLSNYVTTSGLDKYGRIGGYSEKHMFMGEGARKREQEFLKTQLETTNTHISKKETLPDHNPQEPAKNTRTQAPQSQSSEAFKKDTPSQNKNLQQGSTNALFGKDGFIEKPGFNHNQSTNYHKGSVTNYDSKSDLHFPEKTQQIIRNEKKDPREKPGFNKDESRNLQTQQKSQHANQEIREEESKQYNRHGIKTEEHGEVVKQKIKTDKNFVPKDKPGFHQGVIKDPYAEKNLDPNTKSQMYFNKSQDINKNQQSNHLNKFNRYDNTNQEYHGKQPSNTDNYSRNQSQDRSLRNSSQDYSNRSQSQDYSKNRNQNHERFGKTQTHDQFDRYTNQDNFNRNRSQDRFDRNQNHDQSRNQSSFGRVQEHSSVNQNISDKSQTYDKYNECRNRDQDRFNRNQNVGKEYHENIRRNQEQYHTLRNNNEDKRSDRENPKTKLSSHGDKYNESRNRDHDKYHAYHDSTESSWDYYDNIKTKSNFQKASDNKNKQQSTVVYNQREFHNEELVDKQLDIQKQANTLSNNEHINTVLSKSNTTFTTQSNTSINSIVSSFTDAKHPGQSANANMKPLSLTINDMKKDYKNETSKAETIVTFSHVHESLPSEHRPNVVLAFEGNQNVQRALGLNQSPSHTVQTINSQLIHAAYTNSMVNVNALPFDASTYNSQQGLNYPFMDPLMSMSPYHISANLNNPEVQNRMNEISNLSHEIYRCHSTVVTLAKQLASAQADLLVAEAKLSQYQQPLVPTVTTTASSTIHTENSSLPANFFSMPCVTPSSFTTTTPNLQKLQPAETFQLSKNYLASNAQQDFASENHSSPALDQRMLQQYHFYQQQQENINDQHYNAHVSSNVSSANDPSRERVVPQPPPQPQPQSQSQSQSQSQTQHQPQLQTQINKGRELRGYRSQF